MRGQPCSLDPKAARGHAHEGQSQESSGGCCPRAWGSAGLRTMWGPSPELGLRMSSCGWLAGSPPVWLGTPASGRHLRWAHSPVQGLCLWEARPAPLQGRLEAAFQETQGFSRSQYGTVVTSPTPLLPTGHGRRGRAQASGMEVDPTYGEGPPPCPALKAVRHLESWLSSMCGARHEAMQPRGWDAALPVPAYPLLSTLVCRDGGLGTVPGTEISAERTQRPWLGIAAVSRRGNARGSDVPLHGGR